MSLVKDNFVKSLIISFYNTTLITFINMYENVKMTYSKIWME